MFVQLLHYKVALLGKVRLRDRLAFRLLFPDGIACKCERTQSYIHLTIDRCAVSWKENSFLLVSSLTGNEETNGYEEYRTISYTQS